MTYVMSLAARRLGQLLRRAQLLIKLLTLLLRTRILPIRTERMAKRTLPLSFGPALQLLQQRLAPIQAS